MKGIQYVRSQCSKSVITSSLKAAALALLLAVPLAGCEESKPADKPAEAQQEEAKPEAKKEEAKSGESSVEVKTEEITYTAGDVTLKGFLAFDAY